MSNCTDCILDLTDACPKGAGRAIDDEICDSFILRETYEVNKNESWQLGYEQGKADTIKELKKKIEFDEKRLYNYVISESNATITLEMIKKLIEQLKLQN